MASTKEAPPSRRCNKQAYDRGQAAEEGSQLGHRRPYPLGLTPQRRRSGMSRRHHSLPNYGMGCRLQLTGSTCKVVKAVFWICGRAAGLIRAGLSPDGSSAPSGWDGVKAEEHSVPRGWPRQMVSQQSCRSNELPRLTVKSYFRKSWSVPDALLVPASRKPGLGQANMRGLRKLLGQGNEPLAPARGRIDRP